MLNQFQYCEREGVPLIVIVGEEERARGGVKIRDVEKRQEVHCCAPTQANNVMGPHKALCGLLNIGQLITITIVTSSSSLTRDRNHITCKFVLGCESFYGYFSALHLHTPSPQDLVKYDDLVPEIRKRLAEMELRKQVAEKELQ